MTKQLPPDATLQSLEQEVQEVLTAWEPGKPDSAFATQVQPEPKLEDARRVVAESYGFESWEQLAARFEPSPSD